MSTTYPTENKVPTSPHSLDGQPLAGASEQPAGLSSYVGQHRRSAGHGRNLDNAPRRAGYRARHRHGR
jgi:hypothetical protein